MAAFEQGSSSLLLNIYGPLPVKFRGTTYAFPISIWVPREYPREPTIQFVTPTKEMVIRPGQHVSGEGRIYHPYLSGWRDDVSQPFDVFPLHLPSAKILVLILEPADLDYLRAHLHYPSHFCKGAAFDSPAKINAFSSDSAPTQWGSSTPSTST